MAKIVLRALQFEIDSAVRDAVGPWITRLFFRFRSGSKQDFTSGSLGAYAGFAEAFF